MDNFIMRFLYSITTHISVKQQAKLSNKHLNGFTLIELMVSVAIAAILSAVALPSLNDFLVKMRVDNEVTEMQRLILTARNTAINSGQNASVCPLQGTACSGANNWLGTIGVVSADGVVKEKSAINAGDLLKFSSEVLTYTPTGQLTGGSGIFSYCPKGFTSYSRGIEVSLSGRSYLTSDNNGDGKDQTRSGANISC